MQPFFVFRREARPPLLDDLVGRGVIFPGQGAVLAFAHPIFRSCCCLSPDELERIKNYSYVIWAQPDWTTERAFAVLIHWYNAQRSIHA
jgi:hypothetical protein